MRKIVCFIVILSLCLLSLNGCLGSEGSGFAEDGIDDVSVLLIVIGVFTVIALIVYFVQWLDDFEQELKHLNNEIERTDGKERKHWIKRRRRLWLSIIPFIKY